MDVFENIFKSILHGSVIHIIIQYLSEINLNLKLTYGLKKINVNRDGPAYVAQTRKHQQRDNMCCTQNILKSTHYTFVWHG